ncbi:MAG TPA: sulfotransferase [Myxococcota bacterium]|nr:sulfotransferase [Myxococcota bacterium]
MGSSLNRLYRRLRFGKPIIVVSGLPRSGTSLGMKMLEAGGLPIVTDGVRTADEDNPNGYYEDERVKQLHEAVDRRWLRDARGRGVKIISYLLKSLPGDSNYKVIFLRRNPQEILKSQAKMLARRGEVSETSNERMLELMKKDLDDARFFLRRPHFEVLELNYKETLEHPREHAKRIAEFLAEPLDVEKMASVVDVQLYRNRA